MKLYATTKSERATKGQGGNDFLEILISVEKDNKKREIVANLNVFNDREQDQYIFTFVPLDVQRFKKKNKKSIAMKNKTIRWCCSKNENPKSRLEYLRKELRAERISYGELVELQGLADHIEDNDIELLEAIGVPEKGKKQKGF